jgi:hypothetical protein
VKYLLLTLTIFLYTGCFQNIANLSPQQNIKTTNYKELAETSLETLNSADQERFITEIAPHSDDMKALLIYDMNQKLAKISNEALRESYKTRTLKEIDRVTQNFKDEHTAIIKNIRLQWSAIEAKGYENGLDWKQALFKNAEFIPQDILEVAGLKRGDVFVSFGDGKRDFSYVLYDCVKMPYERFRCVGIREFQALK